MLFNRILVMLAITTTSSLANPFQTYINNRATCDGMPIGVNFCTDDCKQTVRCVAGIPITINDCDASGTYCYQFADGSAPVCSTVSQCGGPIQCFQAGEFPDPDICTKYHKCSSPPGTSIVHDCPGTAYNIATNACDLPVNTPDLCGPEGPVPECTFKGQVGTLAHNPSYYYVCVQSGTVLYPGLWKCRDGYIYDPDEKRCFDPLTTTPSSTTSVTTSTTTLTSTTTESTTTTIPTETTTSSTTTETTTSVTTTTPTVTTSNVTSSTDTSTTDTTSTDTTSTDTTSTDTTSTDTTSTDTTSTDTTSTDTSSTDTTTSTSSGTSTSSSSSTSVPSTTSNSGLTTLPSEGDPFDYTVTIAVGTTVAAIVVIGSFVAAAMCINRRKIIKPESRKLF